MKTFNSELQVGMKLLYNGEPIRWVNPKTGKIDEVMNQGKYVISRIDSNYIRLKSARKNAKTEHIFRKSEIEGKIQVVEFKDLTCTMGFIAMNLTRPKWILFDDKFEDTIDKAKKYNRS